METSIRVNALSESGTVRADTLSLAKIPPEPSAEHPAICVLERSEGMAGEVS